MVKTIGGGNMSKYTQSPVQVHKLKDGNLLHIYHDETPFNPREDSDFYVGKMVCFHKRYSLPNEINDVRLKDPDNFGGWDDVFKYIKRVYKPKAILPIYMYDHGGITLQTTPFACPWDSGSVGFIFTDNNAIDKAFGKKRATKAVLEACLRAEVDEYDMFVRGEVYGYGVVREKVCSACGHTEIENADPYDSCWGFYGIQSILDEFKSRLADA